MLCSSKTSCDGFCSSEVVKESVGMYVQTDRQTERNPASTRKEESNGRNIFIYFSRPFFRRLLCSASKMRVEDNKFGGLARAEDFISDISWPSIRTGERVHKILPFSS